MTAVTGDIEDDAVLTVLAVRVLSGGTTKLCYFRERTLEHSALRTLRGKRLRIKFLPNFPAVAIGDLLPRLINVIKSCFWLGLTRQNG
jgi:hypothetical protein